MLQVLSELEESIRGDDFANKMQRARQCPHSEQGSEELDALLDGFVVVSKEDAVDAMASYLAAWLSSVPEAQNMDPKKLQHALLTTVKVCSLFSSSLIPCCAVQAPNRMGPMLQQVARTVDQICLLHLRSPCLASCVVSLIPLSLQMW